MEEETMMMGELWQITPEAGLLLYMHKLP
jgi:hypothetical protein